MQHRSEETRQHILEAATHLFASTGYDATGVAEICQVAGVSKGAFYHHFPTKQAVFMALLNLYLNGIESGFSVMRQAERDVPQAMIQMAELAGFHGNLLLCHFLDRPGIVGPEGDGHPFGEGHRAGNKR